MNLNHRLGRYRRNRRDYSYLQRKAGLDAGDRLKLRRYTNMVPTLLIAHTEEEKFIEKERKKPNISTKHLQNLTDSNNDLLLAITMLNRTILDMRTPCLIVPDAIDHDPVTFDSFSANEYEFLFGFTKEDVVILYNALNIPNTFTINEGHHSFSVPGDHAFLYFLFRYHSPSPRQVLDVTRWHYDHTVLGKMFNKVVEFVDANHSHRLINTIPQLVNKFPLFNQRIRETIAAQNNGYIPPDAERCALFADGTRFRICRPSGAYWRQKAVFSGDKWFHNQGAQVVMGPDGMIYDWWDNPLGRFSDKHFMADSNLNQILRDSQVDQIIQYWAYTDKGYDFDTHLRCAAHGPSYVSPIQHHNNYVMSRERIGVEWGIGKMKQLFPFVVQSRLMKIQKVDVPRYMRVGALLTNAHTCLHQSEVGLYFNCVAPTIESYFS